MLKKIKHISILFIVTFYVLQSSSFFTINLIENIQEIKNRIQISKTHLAEKKELSIAFWNNQRNKKEIKIGNHFYDIISFTIIYDKVVITAVKDVNEYNFTTLLDDLLEEDGSHQSDKKKSGEPLKILTYFTSQKIEFEHFFDKSQKNNSYHILNKKPSKITLPLFKPPC